MLCLPPLFPPSWPVVIAVLVQIIVYFAIAEFIFTYQSETMKCFWKYIDTRMRGELWGRYVFSSSNLQVSFRSSEFHYLRAHANFGFWTMQEHSFRSICCDGSVEMLFLLEVIIKFPYITSFNHALISLFILAEFIIDGRLIFSLLLYNLSCYIAN